MFPSSIKIIWKKAFLCHNHAVIAKNHQKVWSMCRVVVLIIKPNAFFMFSSYLSDLKVPTVFVKSDNFDTIPQGIIKRSWVIIRTVQMIVWDKTAGNLSWFSLECFWMLSNTATKSIKALATSLLSHLETQLETLPSSPTGTFTLLQEQLITTL